jgi:hypothetical protein
MPFALKEEEMKSLKSLTAKGETNMYYIALGVMLTVLVIFGLNYYHDHRNDVTVHPPHIEVH